MKEPAFLDEDRPLPAPLSVRRPEAAGGFIDAADLIIAYLENLGVEYVFGVPGGAVEPLFNALARSQRRGGPRPVIARHEGGAAYMADGYARETGRIGVCIATSGPGATNLITGVACAHQNNIPMLAITGQPALPSFGKGALQDSSCTGVNVVGMFRHCTHYDSLISHVDQLDSKLASALMRACQVPEGPAHLSIPVDIQRSPVAPGARVYDLRKLFDQRPSQVDDVTLRDLKARMAAVRSLVFLIGGSGSAGAAARSIVRLAEISGALFITTPDGKGFIDPRHPAYRGVFGFAGHESAADLLSGDPDLVIAFGTGFGEFSSSGWSPSLLNDRLIHVDDSAENLLRSPMAKLHVRGSIESVCERLAALLEEERGMPIHRPAPPPAAVPVPAAGLSDGAGIKPQQLMAGLSRYCLPDTRFVADAGNSFIWAVHCLMPPPGRVGESSEAGPDRRHGRRRARYTSWLRVTMDFAPMGWAIGSAVGVARGNPAKPVVCITGDGSYLMSGQEITVAAEERLTVIFVILNDGALGMVMHGQRLAGAEPIGFTLPRVDYRQMAEAMGIPGHVIATARDLDALDWPAIMRRPGPTLLDVRIDGEEVPPMRLRLKTLGSIAEEP